MITLHKRFSCDIWERCCFDPATLMAGSAAATAVGSGMSAAGTLAGGSYAKVAGQMQQNEANYEADQLTENAGQAIASSQRQMLDTRLKTNLAISSARANAAGNGVNAGVGSPVSDVEALARRGSYSAAMDMFNGLSASTGLLNEAAGKRYSGQLAAIGGQEAQQASLYSAAGTIAGGAGSAFKGYGSYAYPQNFRSS